MAQGLAGFANPPFTAVAHNQLQQPPLSAGVLSVIEQIAQSVGPVGRRAAVKLLKRGLPPAKIRGGKVRRHFGERHPR